MTSGNVVMEEEEDFPTSFCEDFDVFPRSVVFQSTFPNVISHFTVFLSNPQADPITVKTSIRKGAPFSVSSESITILPGTVYSLVVTFATSEIGEFRDSLQISVENGETFDVELEGGCEASPLLVPCNDITDFIFASGKSIFKPLLGNRSLSKSLRVVLDVDTSAFRVTPSSIEIPPFSQCPIEISYEKQKLESEPHFLVQCEDSGDSLLIPLRVVKSNSTAAVEFGIVPVGVHVSKTIKLPNTENVPVLDEPFEINVIDEEEDDDEDRVVVCFGFFSEDPGRFEKVVDFGDVSVRMTGEAVVLPFSLEMPECEMEPLIITNTTDHAQSYKVSFSNNFDRFHATKVKLESGESQKVDISSVENALYFRWKVDGKEVFYTVKVPKTGIAIKERVVDFEIENEGESEKPIEIVNTNDEPMTVNLVTDTADFDVDRSVTIEPHSSQLVNVSFTPTSSKRVQGQLSIISKNGHAGTVALRSLKSLAITKKMIPFLRMVDGKQKSFTFSFCGASKASLRLPDWLTGPEEVETTNPIVISCGTLPYSVCADHVVLSSEKTTPCEIPVIAYRGGSDIHWSITRTNEITVENRGIRPAFVIISPSNNAAEVTITPPHAIIPPARSTSFTITTEEECTVEMHYGDEILRQIHSELLEDAFWDSLDGIMIRDELGPIRNVLDSLDPTEFEAVFHASVSHETIELSIPTEATVFGLSTRKIDFGEINPDEHNELKLWIENLLMTPIDLQLSSESKVLTFPKKLRLRPGEKAVIPIEIDCLSDEIEINEVIRVKCGESASEIQVHAAVRDEGAFEAEILNFGLCEVGRLNRGILKLTNKKSKASEVRISVNPPFSSPNEFVFVDSKSFIYISIHFLPQRAGPFQEEIRFDPDISRPFSVPVIGSAS